MSLEGAGKLKARLRATGDTRGLLKTLQLAAVAEAKALVPRKTDHLGRSIGPGSLGNDYALVHARTAYAAYVEYGTKAHVIKPKRAKVLAFPANASGRRLSGRARKGAGLAFARKVRHPGTRPQPYLVPGAVAALRKGGLRARIVKNWNEAA